MRILFVDDDQSMHILGKRICRAFGYEYVGATTVDEGREKILTQVFDMLVLDTEIGSQLGFELVSDAQQRGVKYIGSSADHSYRSRWIDLGSAGFLAKPYAPRAFKKMIEEATA